MIFFHYAFATQVTRIFLQTFEEGCRTLVFFLMMNFFIKMTSKLLKNRKRWLTIFRVLWNLALLMFIIVELYVIIAVARQQLTDDKLCRTSTYLVLQIGNSILTVAFIILGYFIDKRVQEQKEAENQFEIAFRQETQSKALGNLKMIIFVFSLVQLYCLVYASVMFGEHANCEYPS